MVLVDTSVWIDHFRRGNSKLSNLLDEAKVSSHPLIIGELACGGLKQRNQIIDLLKDLPQSLSASHDEVLIFIDHHKLYDKGLSYIDVQLLASARLSQIPIWTLDKKLKSMSKKFDLEYKS